MLSYTWRSDSQRGCQKELQQRSIVGVPAKIHSLKRMGGFKVKKGQDGQCCQRRETRILLRGMRRRSEIEGSGDSSG